MSRSTIVLIIAVYVTSLAVGCASASGTSVSTGLGQPFQLKVGQTASIESEDLRVKFVEVSEDSRCPLDVLCIQAGQARIIVQASKGGQDLGSPEVTLAAGGEGSPATLDGYSISLTELAPYPESTNPTAPSDYVATLIVVRE
jgi:hypothetical protein